MRLVGAVGADPRTPGGALAEGPLHGPGLDVVAAPVFGRAAGAWPVLAGAWPVLAGAIVSERTLTRLLVLGCVLAGTVVLEHVFVRVLVLGCTLADRNLGWAVALGHALACAVAMGPVLANADMVGAVLAAAGGMVCALFWGSVAVLPVVPALETFLDDVNGLEPALIGSVTLRPLLAAGGAAGPGTALWRCGLALADAAGHVVAGAGNREQSVARVRMTFAE